MRSDLSWTTGYRQRRIGSDLALAIGMALVLALTWTLRDWANLHALILPDTDDMARLAQVRDWLNGQAFNDWTQYRIGPVGGAPMHWSRINDLGIAAIIKALRPLVGTHAAEIGAVIAYPSSLFAFFLFVSGRIARRLWPLPDVGAIAIVLTALAYPATTLFAPGRIDHHALQIVCLAIALWGVLGAASLKSGVIAGTAIAVSLGIGLETLPQIGAMIAAMGMTWIVAGQPRQGQLLAGLGLGLMASTAIMLLTMRPTLWSSDYCDTFTPASTDASLIGGAVLIACGYATAKPRSWPGRAALAGLGGGCLAAVIVWRFPTCLSGPYGHLDPFVRRAMIDHIGEAMPLIGGRSWSEATALGGLLAVALLASIWVFARYPLRRERMAPVMAIIVMSAAVALFQARGANFGAAFAAPLLAGIVALCRRRRRLGHALLAWLLCCGVTWSIAPAAFAGIISVVPHSETSTPLTAEDARHPCWTPSTFTALDRLRPGTVMASIDLSAYLLGATRNRVVGSSYHRNTSGTAAMYRFFLSSPGNARRIAAQWHADYVAFCPGDFSELDVTHGYPNSVAATLARGQVPDWLKPVEGSNASLQFYRIRQ